MDPLTIFAIGVAVYLVLGASSSASSATNANVANSTNTLAKLLQSLGKGSGSSGGGSPGGASAGNSAQNTAGASPGGLDIPTFLNNLKNDTVATDPTEIDNSTVAQEAAPDSPTFSYSGVASAWDAFVNSGGSTGSGGGGDGGDQPDSGDGDTDWSDATE